MNVLIVRSPHAQDLRSVLIGLDLLGGSLRRHFCCPRVQHLSPHSPTLPTPTSFALPLSFCLCLFHVFNAFLQLDLRQHLDKLQAPSNDTNQLLFVSSSSSCFPPPRLSSLLHCLIQCRLSLVLLSQHLRCVMQHRLPCNWVKSDSANTTVHSLQSIYLYIYTYISAITADVSACQMSEPFFMLISIAIEPHEPQREESKGQEGST